MCEGLGSIVVIDLQQQCCQENIFQIIFNALISKGIIRLGKLANKSFTDGHLLSHLWNQNEGCALLHSLRSFTLKNSVEDSWKLNLGIFSQSWKWPSCVFNQRDGSSLSSMLQQQKTIGGQLLSLAVTCHQIGPADRSSTRTVGSLSLLITHNLYKCNRCSTRLKKVTLLALQ